MITVIMKYGLNHEMVEVIMKIVDVIMIIIQVIVKLVNHNGKLCECDCINHEYCRFNHEDGYRL